MNIPRFSEGQTIKILPLTGSDASADRRLAPYAGKTGRILSYWCLTRDEMPELSKSFVYPDIYCYDIQLDEDGGTVRGVPEPALEEHRK